MPSINTAVTSNRDGHLLSPSLRHHDDDASSIHSERSDQDTDSEDDVVLMGARTSADVRDHDRSVLTEEEETGRLLEESRRRKGRRGSALEIVGKEVKKLFGRSYSELPGIDSEKGDNGATGVGGKMEVGSEKGEGRRERRRKRRARRARKKERLMQSAEEGEDGELMYEMEEGGLKEGSSTGNSSEGEGSDEHDRQGLLGLREEKAKKRRRWRQWCFLHLLIATGFAILVLVAWKLSLKTRMKTTKIDQKMLSNGTALFAPTTILISLDGFRADFLNRGITPRLNKFIQEGVSPPHMLPSFPSVTFPNHYTLATGLYPEAHGIVGNTFWDETLQEEFYYTNPSAMEPKWWGGEPLWVTAESQGIRTAIHMWPGSEAHIMGVEPSFLDKYFGKEALPNKVNRILGLLDRPGLENEGVEVADMRPQLIAAYVPNVDSEGHKYGPNSTEIRISINMVDFMLDDLFKGLDARNLTDIVNVVIVSDHGMATTSTYRLIQLEDLIDTSLIAHTDGWPLYGLRPKDPKDLQSLYDTLKEKSASNPNFEVYLRDKDMPERYHFSKNERIAPLWIIPKAGWAIVTKDEFNVTEAQADGLEYLPRGLHGYDHEHPLMRSIFVARGPAFPHAGNSRVDPFQNIEVYNIICDSLGLEPKPNNGTMRLPLKPVGVHTPDTSPADPHDPPHGHHHDIDPTSSSMSSFALATPPSSISTTPASTEAAPNAVITVSPIEASSAANPNEKPPTMVGVDPVDNVNVERPVVGDESGLSDEEKSFWEWVTGKLEGLKGWFGEIVHSGKGEGKGERTEDTKGGKIRG